MPKRVRRGSNAPEGVVSLDETVDADPLNHAHPSVVPVQEQTNPGEEENAAGNTAPHLAEEGNAGPDAGGINEHENSQPTRGNTPPINLASPEREQHPRASDGKLPYSLDYLFPFLYPSWLVFLTYIALLIF